MTKEELQKLRQKLPDNFPFAIEPDPREDEYGVYDTGLFRWKGKNILINIEDGAWHLSIGANHTLGYYELKEIRYKFMPDDMDVAQIFPSREEFVNVHPNCFHLFELKKA